MGTVINFQELFTFESQMKSIEERIKSLSKTILSFSSTTVMPTLSVQDNLTPVLDAAIDKMNQLGQMSVAAPVQAASGGNGTAASAERTIDISKSFSELSDLFKSTHDFLDNFGEKEKPTIICNCMCGNGISGKKGKKGKGGKRGSAGKGSTNKDTGAKQGKGNLFQKALKLTANPKMLKGLKVASTGANLLGKAVKPLSIVADISTIIKSDNKLETLKKVGASNLGSAAGAAIGTMLLPGVGTVVGGMIGSYAPEIFKFGKAGLKKLFKNDKDKVKSTVSTVSNLTKTISSTVKDPMSMMPPSIVEMSKQVSNPNTKMAGVYPNTLPIPMNQSPQKPISLNIEKIGVEILTKGNDVQKIAQEIFSQFVSEITTALQNRI